MKEFIDTNVLLYAYDPSAGAKHQVASELVLRLAREHQAAVSVQVMQEFYVNAVSKIAQPMSVEQALLRLDAFSRWTVHSPLPGDVREAAQLATKHQLSFWDAMIVVSASRLECSVLWTEDLNAGQTIEGVKVQNPLPNNM